MKTAIKIALTLASIGLFVWFLLRSDLDEVWRAFQALGSHAPLVMLPYLIVYGFDTCGWAHAFPRSKPSGLPWLRFFNIRWAGECVNHVVPSGYLGGEAVKVYLLARRGVPTAQGASSVIVSKTIQSLAQVCLLIIGALAALTSLEAGSAVYKGTLAILVLSSVGLVVMFWLQRRGLFKTLISVLTFLRLKPAALQHSLPEFLKVDAAVIDFYRDEKAAAARSFAFFFLGWLAGAIEAWLVARLIGTPIGWGPAIAIEACIGIAKGIAFFVPGGLGVQESSIVLLARALGLPESYGVAYAVLRRGRETLYTVIGGFCLLGEGVAWRGLGDKVREEIKELS